MIVKKIVIDEPKIFLEYLIKELINNDINYCLINNDSFIELHFDNYIYHIFDLKNHFKTMINSIELSNKKITYEKTGYKKYTVNDIKKENKKSKISKSKVYKRR